MSTIWEMSAYTETRTVQASDMASSTSSLAASATAAVGNAASNATTQGAASQGEGGGYGDEDEVDGQMLMYHINILFLALLALFFVLRLPRALARLYSASEWMNGHILRSVPYHSGRSRAFEYNHRQNGVPGKGEVASDESHTMYAPTTAYLHRVDQKAVGNPIKKAYPPHFTSCVSFLRPTLKLLRKRVSPGFSISQMIIVCVWFSVLIYPTLYKSSGPFTDPARAGWIGTAQLPFVFAFASKNNVLGAFLGMGYEKLNYLHRFIARLVVLAVNIHSLAYIYKWLIEERFQETMAISSNYWGLIGLIAFDGLFLFSTAWWRQKFYNFFLFTHIVCYTLVFPALWFHEKSTKPWIYACVAVYAFDYLLRCVKTRFATATIRPLSELGLTRVEIPSINSGWRAGQHVRLRIMSSGMGALGWAEVHPFTIASASNTPEGMVLMCKKAGGWTNRLFDIAKQAQYHNAEGAGAGTISVVVEGPYGGPGHTMFASYSAAVFVCGGSGITFGLSAVQELVKKDLDGESRVKVIELIWVVQDPASLVPLLPQLSSLIAQSVFTPVKVSVYYTKAPIGKFPFADDFFHPRLSLSPGRPKIGKILESAIAKTVQLGAGKYKDHERNSGLLVGVCGPVGLADDVSRECCSVDPYRRDQVGGVDLHEDVFGW